MHIKNTKLKKAFTLVELIVVIVILAILATIAFLSFSNQSSSARDSTRMADLSNILKGLGVFSAVGGTYPIPDKSINIMSGSTQIGYQGEAGKNTLKMINFSAGGGKDPIDGTYYTLNTNFLRNKVQILGFLENQGSVALELNPFGELSQSFATDYTNRYPYEQGDELGILLVKTGTGISTYTPIQDTSLSSSGFDTQSGTQGSGVVAVINNSSLNLPKISETVFNGYTSTGPTVTGSGEVVFLSAPVYSASTTYSSGEQFTYSGITVTVSSTGVGIGDTKYPGCDTPDIVIWKAGAEPQIWAACNVGAINAFTGTNPASACAAGCAADPYPTLHNVFGSIFQWGRNDDLTLQGTPTTTQASGGTLADGVGHSNFIKQTYSWGATSLNLWGGSGTTNTAGTYQTQGNPVVMKGPCQSGYHVPTRFEWWNTISAINNSISNSINTFQTDTNSSVSNALKLPYAGFRVSTTAYYGLQGGVGYFWTSSNFDPTYSYTVGVKNGQLILVTSAARTQGSSVRCMKN